MRIFSNDVYGFMPLRTIWSSERNIISFFFWGKLIKETNKLMANLSY